MDSLTLNLIDAAQQHRLTPDTFTIPSVAALQEVSAGHLVKIGVTFEPGENDEVSGERFWVIVRHFGHKLTGTVDNDLIYPHRHGLKLGDGVAFERRHILDIGEPQS